MPNSKNQNHTTVSINPCKIQPKEKPIRLNNARQVRLAAYTVSMDWPVFTLHNNHVKPSREHDFYHGEPCSLRSAESRKGMELPPGAGSNLYLMFQKLVEYDGFFHIGSISLRYFNFLVYRYNCTNGHPATSWSPFLFPNPPRRFLLKQPHSTSLCFKTTNTPKYGHSNVPPNVAQKPTRDKYASQCAKEMNPSLFCDLERQIWMDPEIRVERAFRMYADSKYCTKGSRIKDISQLLRPGW
ncbi:uncharacterized protein LOC128883317 isoform X2 [Hylaeus volcanicus]|uniref:uncharacterized protein LOC128883317 isoform X2 n=1 Tax=Hylaeus volcanicus TaxID=313075 RepID=UPI0023B80174|nr:uncharacterized protein LOC128883317 isoform X2 [Hylaeus volcanicus]